MQHIMPRVLTADITSHYNIPTDPLLTFPKLESSGKLGRIHEQLGKMGQALNSLCGIVSKASDDPNIP